MQKPVTKGLCSDNERFFMFGYKFLMYAVTHCEALPLAYPRLQGATIGNNVCPIEYLFFGTN